MSPGALPEGAARALIEALPLAVFLCEGAGPVHAATPAARALVAQAGSARAWLEEAPFLDPQTGAPLPANARPLARLIGAEGRTLRAGLASAAGPRLLHFHAGPLPGSPLHWLSVTELGPLPDATRLLHDLSGALGAIRLASDGGLLSADPAAHERALRAVREACTRASGLALELSARCEAPGAPPGAMAGAEAPAPAEPAAPEAPPEIPARPAAPAQDGPPPGARVLVVEDDAAFRSLLGEALRLMALEVTLTAQPQEALEALAGAEPCDLLITDLRLGAGMDGHGLAARAQALRPGLPVLYVSGQPQGAEPPEGAVPGRVLRKPSSIAALRRAVTLSLRA